MEELFATKNLDSTNRDFNLPRLSLIKDFTERVKDIWLDKSIVTCSYNGHSKQ